MHGIKSSWLTAFVAAVEQRSIRGAASHLGVSQPAITRLVHDLERDIGAPLLTRSSGGVIPTAQGQVLYEHARIAMRELVAARAEIGRINGQAAGEISIAAVPLAVMFVPQAMRTFRECFPGTQIRLREELYMERMRLLREGRVDIAVGPIPSDLSTSEFESEEMLVAEMAVVVGRGHRLARATSLRDVAPGRWVYTSAVLGEEDYAHTLFAMNGIQPPAPAAIVNSTLALLSLVAQGDYVALMPRRMAEHPAVAHALCVVQLVEGFLSLPVGSITLRRASVKESVKQFIAHLRIAAGVHAAFSSTA